MRIRRSNLRLWSGVGLCLCAISVCGFLWAPQAALPAWLAGAFFWSGIPVGSLGLLMMMRLIPGAWSDELRLFAEAGTMLLPLAALSFLPVLAGMGFLYEWAKVSPEGAFQAFYLTPWFFVLRSILWFALLAGLSFLFLTRRVGAVALSCIGLILFIVLGSAIAIDWLMSLDPKFHSSVFGLYALSTQMTVALVWMIAASLVSAHHPKTTGVLGALMLTVLLIWTYLAFMQYFILWSGNLPHDVLWYRRRGTGLWSFLEEAMAALHLGPLLLLILPLRNSRTWLLGLGGAVLLGKVLETAWLVLPGSPGSGWLGAGFLIACVLGWGCLSVAAYAAACEYRIRNRMPSLQAREAMP